MGIFSGIEDEDPTAGGKYWPLGQHKAVITRVHEKKKGYKSPAGAFIVEAAALESSNDKVMIGSTYSWVQKMDKKGALARVLTFIMTATGSAKEDVDEEAAEAICASSQPLAGMVIAVEGYDTETEAKKSIVAVRWDQITDEQELKRLFKKAKDKKLAGAPCALQAAVLK